MNNKLRRGLAALCKRDEGLTTVEYAVAGTLIALAVITAFTNLGSAVTAQVQAIVAVLNG